MLLLMRRYHQELLGWAYFDHVVGGTESSAKASLTVRGIVIVVCDRGAGVLVVISASTYGHPDSGRVIRLGSRVKLVSSHSLMMLIVVIRLGTSSSAAAPEVRPTDVWTPWSDRFCSFTIRSSNRCTNRRLIVNLLPLVASCLLNCLRLLLVLLLLLLIMVV